MANELSVILDTCVEEHKVLKCKQNDNRTLEATLLDKGSPFSFSNYINIDIRVKKADSKVYIQTLNNSDEGILFAINNNILTVKLEQDITRVAGLTDIELAITYTNNNKITTFTFALDVKSSTIIDGDVVSDNASNLLDKLNGSYLQFQSLLGISLIKVRGNYTDFAISVNGNVVADIDIYQRYGALETLTYSADSKGYVHKSTEYFSDSNDNAIPLINKYMANNPNDIVIIIFPHLIGGEWYSHASENLIALLTDLGGNFINLKSTYAGFGYVLIGKKNLGSGLGFEGTSLNAASGFIDKSGDFIRDSINQTEITKILTSRVGGNILLNGDFKNGMDNWSTRDAHGDPVILDTIPNGYKNKPCLRVPVNVGLFTSNITIEGDYITISFWYKLVGTATTPTLSVGGDHFSDYENTNVITDTWTHYLKTFDLGIYTPSNLGIGSNCDLYIAEISLSSNVTQHNINIEELQDLVDTKVDKVAGKSLLLDTEIARLGGMATGATKTESSTINGNININGTETPVYVHPGTGTNPHGTTKADVSLGNVPNVDTNSQTPTYTEDSTLETISSGEYLTIAFGKIKKAINSLISHIANVGNPHGVNKAQVGLGNVDNTSDLNKPVSTATQSALDGKINTSQKGVANGVAQLDSNGVVPSSQLPSYVNDVLEYTSNALFPATGESGKIYLNTTNNLSYRWAGSGYAEISPSIALGETSSTAYAGDKGKTTTDKVDGHIGNTTNPHNVTKAQVGLGNVDNVNTNGQTPTYTVASTNTTLTSGETLTTAFGKIAKAISSLIAHLADTVSHITSTERTNWNSASANNHTHSNKTTLDNTTASYTTAEQTKLSGIANNANNYTLPVASTVIGGVKSGTDITIDTSGNVSINDNSHNHTIGNVDGLQTALDGKVDDSQVLTNVPSGAKFTDTVTTINSKTGVIAKADIVALGIPAQDTTYSVFTPTVNGLTPLSGGGTTKYLRADGTWAIPPDTNTTYAIATTSANGLMSSTDKTKLDGIATGANNYSLPIASAAIGGVKSGTDITVDASGNVSVNDDSHNHVIANVDGLQTALDGKVDDGQVLTNVPSGAKFTDTVYAHPATHPPSMISQDASNRFVSDSEKANWNNKFDKSGGTLTGDLKLEDSKAVALKDLDGVFRSVLWRNASDKTILGNGVHGVALNIPNATALEAYDVANTAYRKIYHEGNKPSLAELGAAPSGFGLGAQLINVQITDSNNALTTGMYYVQPTDPNKPPGVNDGALLVLAFDNSWVNQMWFDWRTNKTYRRMQTNGVWSAWDALYSGVNKPTFGDLGLNMGGISGTANQIENTDLNNLKTTGFYRGQNMANAPNAYWWYVICIRHADTWVYQEAIAFGKTTFPGQSMQKYYRVCEGGIWSPWDLVYTNRNPPRVVDLPVDYSFTKSFAIPNANEWVDTGITAGDLATGTYVVAVANGDSGNTAMWGERASGIMSWMGTNTNSSDGNEIVLHQTGHASNGRIMRLRTLTHGGGYSTLQLTCNFSLALSAYAFQFKKMI